MVEDMNRVCMDSLPTWVIDLSVTLRIVRWPIRYRFPPWSHKVMVSNVEEVEALAETKLRKRNGKQQNNEGESVQKCTGVHTRLRNNGDMCPVKNVIDQSI